MADHEPKNSENQEMPVSIRSLLHDSDYRDVVSDEEFDAELQDTDLQEAANQVYQDEAEKLAEKLKQYKNLTDRFGLLQIGLYLIVILRFLDSIHRISPTGIDPKVAAVALGVASLLNFRKFYYDVLQYKMERKISKIKKKKNGSEGVNEE